MKRRNPSSEDCPLHQMFELELWILGDLICRRNLADTRISAPYFEGNQQTFDKSLGFIMKVFAVNSDPHGYNLYKIRKL